MGTKKKQRANASRVRSPRLKAFLADELTVEDMDDEELRRGQFRDKNGNFTGRPYQNIPLKFHQTLQAEHLKRLQRTIEKAVPDAIETLIEISQNRRLPADARMKSAIYLHERVAGKTPDKSEITLEVAKWEEDIEDLLTYGGEEKAKGKRKRATEE